MIRLIRIIKLYNYARKSNAEAEEAKIREQAKLSANAQQAALKKELEPSRLGSFLIETLTKRLVIIILILLMVLPNITDKGTNYSGYSGLRELFWFGRSSCQMKDGVDSLCYINAQNGAWIESDGCLSILHGEPLAWGMSLGLPAVSLKRYQDFL